MTEHGTILLVDDDQELRRGLKTVLNKHGYRTLEAEDGIEASEMIDQHRPDLVILDMMMPRWGGLAVLERYCGQSDAPPFIMITANDGPRHKGYAEKLLEEMKSVSVQGLSETAQEELAKAITYFSNHHQQMNYAERVEAKLPIGSGVTEAACKTIVKMRMCRGGAKWKEDGAAAVLSLRTLIYTEERWEQFWAKIDRYGFPIVLAA